jgi:protein TonB
MLYGNIPVNVNKQSKTLSDIEISIIKKPEAIPLIAKSTSNAKEETIIEKFSNGKEVPQQKNNFNEPPKTPKIIAKQMEEKKITKLPNLIQTKEVVAELTESTSLKNKNSTKAVDKTVSTAQLISNLSNLDFTSTKINSSRVKTISARTKDYEYRSYFEAWRQKVERLGALNYPKEAKAGNLGSLKLTVSLSAKGKIESITINKTSGNKALDEAAIKIVKLGEPYAVFSERMRKEVDLINITRIWKFTEDSYSSTN